MGWREIFTFTRKPAQPVQAPAVSTTQPRVKPRKYAIVAAAPASGVAQWTGSSDDFNKEYLDALPAVIQRTQDLDVNNPDVRGYHGQRTSQVIGRGIQWKCAFKAAEIGLDGKQAHELALRIDRKRVLHSRMGGFDATGQKRTEAKLQEIAFKTTLVQGTCLVHRVHRSGYDRISPLALEVIPGIRLETPRDRLGDPLISFGVEYTDERRTEIVGYWVRKPNRTIGAGGMVWDFRYDFLPLEDVALLRMTEIAGLDRSLPATVALVKTLRNKGDFAESAVAAARAQAKRPVGVEVEPGGNAWDRAADDNQQELPDSSEMEQNPVGTVTMGDTEVFYANPGEKLVNLAVNLPGPDFPGFMNYMDQRCARGLNTSVSRFTRQVDSSYSAGRQEEQHDEPAVDQLREMFAIGWQRVHEWFMDSILLSGAEDLPGYAELRAYWTEARITPPGKEHINPVDTMNARRMGYALRTLTPQQACEADGKDLESNLKEWADAIQLVRTTEKDNGLVAGTLDFLLDIPVKEAVDQTGRDGDGDGIVGEGKGNKSAFSAPSKFVSLDRMRAALNGKNGAAHG